MQGALHILALSPLIIKIKAKKSPFFQRFSPHFLNIAL